MENLINNSNIKIVFKNHAKLIKVPNSFSALLETFNSIQSNNVLPLDNNLNYHFMFFESKNESCKIENENDYNLFKSYLISSNKKTAKIFIMENLIKADEKSNSHRENNIPASISNSKFNNNILDPINNTHSSEQLLSKEELFNLTIQNFKKMVEIKMNEMQCSIINELSQSFTKNFDIFYNKYSEPFISNSSNLSNLKSNTSILVDQLIVCDCCKNKIFGVRYKCSKCSEFNRCEACDSVNQMHEKINGEEHIFIKIRKPGYLKTLANFMTRKIQISNRVKNSEKEISTTNNNLNSDFQSSKTTTSSNKSNIISPPVSEKKEINSELKKILNLKINIPVDDKPKDSNKIIIHNKSYNYNKYLKYLAEKNIEDK